MKLTLLTAGLVLLAAGCASAQGPEKKAMALRVRETSFEPPRVVMLKSMPPQFRIVLTREMPTPGWEFVIDSVDVDAASSRIVARVTEKQPEGMVAQVLTPAALAIEVGTLDPGDYFLELWLRARPGSKHRPALALIVEAE